MGLRREQGGGCRGRLDPPLRPRGRTGPEQDAKSRRTRLWGRLGVRDVAARPLPSDVEGVGEQDSPHEQDSTDRNKFQIPIPPNKPTKLSITRWRLVNRGKTPGVSCLLARPACHHQHLRQPSLATSGQDRAPRVPSSWRKTCPPGLQHKDLPVKGLSQVLSGTTGQMRT